MQHNISVAAPPSSLLKTPSAQTRTADILLVDRCKEGAEAATRELFRRHQRRVHGTLYRILGSSNDIDDLMQEAFIQVFKSLPSFRAEAKLATWIDRITVRVAYRYIGKRMRQPKLVDVAEDMQPDVRTTGTQPHQQVASREAIRRLYDALSQLTPAARIAFALHEIDGRSVAEVAETVGASKSACKLRIWRARRTLFGIARTDPILAELLNSDASEGSSS